jgi:phage antirepressor YoqD-like protein
MLILGVCTRLRPFLENIFLEKFVEKNNFLEKFEKKMMKYYQKWAEFGKFLGKTSKNVRNDVKIQKIL